MALLPDVADMATFSLETGLRESNVTLLRWDQVDLQQGIVYIEGDDILKSEKAFVVPLSDVALDIFIKQRASILNGYLPIKGIRSEERISKFSKKPVSELVWRIFVGTICATLGRRGTFSGEHLWKFCKSWAAGLTIRWLSVTLILVTNI